MKEKPSLEDMFKSAERAGVDTDIILDMWNDDRDKLYKYFEEMKILGIVRDYLPHIPKKQELFVGDFENDLAGFRRLMTGLRSEVKTEVNKGTLTAVITISSIFDESVLDEHLVFQCDDPEDEGIKNAISATIDELKFIYLKDL